MSGKKRVALDNRIIYFKELDDDIRFVITFCIGYNTLSLNQIDEDKYDLIIDGYSFYDLMKTERLEKKYQLEKKERDKIKKKKLEEEYYKRALKYNGNDYYEGKTKVNKKKNNNDTKILMGLPISNKNENNHGGGNIIEKFLGK